jgi:hypothetical protein
VWGYRSLPFPPYGHAEMLEFHERLEMTIGITVDHLVLGSSKDMCRLSLDRRAFCVGVARRDVPDPVPDAVDVTIDEWPEE